MTTTLLDAQWTADPQPGPGSVLVGDAIQITIAVDYTKVPHSEVGPDRLSKALRLIRETEALVLAAPGMAMALRAFLASGINARWVDDETGETVNVRKMAEQAYALTGLPLP